MIVEQIQDTHTKISEIRPKGWGKRHTFCLLAFLGFANVFAMRVNLSVAIVKMAKSENRTLSPNVTHLKDEEICPFDSDDLGGEDHIYQMASQGEFEWSAREQGQILGSLFYGNIISQIPAGILAEVIGGKLIFSLGILASSIVTLLTPLFAYHGFSSIIVSRALVGFAQGVTFPSMYVLISEWIPPRERNRLAVFIWSGIQFGTFLTLPVSGYLSESLGWQSVFYLNGSLGLLWFIAFSVLCSSSPSLHNSISTEELFYIETSLPPKIQSKSLKDKLPPLRKMLLSPPVWALVFTHVGNNWGMYTLLTEMPTFLSSVHHFKLTSSGLLSAVPYFLMWGFTIFCGGLASYLRSRDVRSEVIRKTFNTLGHLGPALALIGLSFCGCNHNAVIACFCLAVMLNGAANSGFQVNHVELASNYAGSLMGITNTFANLAGFLAPYVTGLVIHENQTLTSWRTVFLSAAGIYAVDSVIFVLFGSSKSQPWNEKSDVKDSENSKENYVA